MDTRRRRQSHTRSKLQTSFHATRSGQPSRQRAIRTGPTQNAQSEVFALTYMAGWTVKPESTPGAGDAVNEVPASIQLMVTRAIAFRAGSGLGDIGIGSLKIDVADSYKTDALPREIASIGRAFQYRPGIFAARP